MRRSKQKHYDEVELRNVKMCLVWCSTRSTNNWLVHRTCRQSVKVLAQALSLSLLSPQNKNNNDIMCACHYLWSSVLWSCRNGWFFSYAQNENKSVSIFFLLLRCAFLYAHVRYEFEFMGDKQCVCVLRWWGWWLVGKCACREGEIETNTVKWGENSLMSVISDIYSSDATYRCAVCVCERLGNNETQVGIRFRWNYCLMKKGESCR